MLIVSSGLSPGHSLGLALGDRKILDAGVVQEPVEFTGCGDLGVR
ncbi:hypothetical protein QFZ70_002905 [Arthrobacter sp. V1I9]|nr:hypothetical protein [Arthrobacter sp. V1I9]